MTEEKMIEYHHQLNGHEFEQTLGDRKGQGSLACCSTWGCKESDTTERLNNKINVEGKHTAVCVSSTLDTLLEHYFNSDTRRVGFPHIKQF